VCASERLYIIIFTCCSNNKKNIMGERACGVREQKNYFINAGEQLIYISSTCPGKFNWREGAGENGEIETNERASGL
jgi:hypothetical protein